MAISDEQVDSGGRKGSIVHWPDEGLPLIGQTHHLVFSNPWVTNIEIFVFASKALPAVASQNSMNIRNMNHILRSIDDDASDSRYSKDRFSLHPPTCAEVIFPLEKAEEVASTGRTAGLRWIRLVTTDSLDPTRQAGPDPVML